MTTSPVVSPGSRLWRITLARWLGVATAAVLGPLALAAAPSPDRWVAAAAAAAIGLWSWVPLERRRPWVRAGVVVALAGTYYWFVAGSFAGAHLTFVPIVALSGLVGELGPAAFAAAAGAALLGARGEPVADVALSAFVFGTTAGLYGVLARELRTHYRGEQEEHRLATAVRHRLIAVLDAVDEAIVFSDRSGSVRLVNRRAAEIFEVDPRDHVGLPVVQLWRRLARLTEDPEEYMEMFQATLAEPEQELRVHLEQILPARRQLRLYSGPARADGFELVGRIDVYTDITESVRRAAENEQLYERARKTAESYQRALLPERVPVLPRLSIVAHYVPVAGDRGVCGDFYDFVPLADGRVAVVVGDVCGSGPTAASDAALTRYTLASLAMSSADPATLLDRLNERVARQLPQDRFVRVVMGVLDPERAVLEYAGAGHYPPILRRTDGTIEWLEESGLALGIEDDHRYKSATLALEPGDVVVFGTDGIAEAQRSGRPFGRGRLGDVVRDWGSGTPGELVQAIRRSVETWVPEGEERDDIALLVCQVAPDEALEQPVREILVANEPARIGDVRAFVAGFLTELRLPVDTVHDLVLAAGEAAANAALHGRRKEGRSELRVRCEGRGDEVVVTIADDGPGFDVSSVLDRIPDRFASGGRGLLLMRTLADHVDISATETGTSVTLLRRVEPAAAGSPQRDT